MCGLKRRVVVSVVGLLAACVGLTAAAVADNGCNGQKVVEGQPCGDYTVGGTLNGGSLQTKCEGLGTHGDDPPCVGYTQPKSVAIKYKCWDVVPILVGVVGCGPAIDVVETEYGPVPIPRFGVCLKYRPCKVRTYGECYGGDEVAIPRLLYDEWVCEAEPIDNPPLGDQ